jgi:enamine deaminase RidA (YjgF/YER057c/UK114 family)
VQTRLVFGTLLAVLAALAVSLVSTLVTTVFVERHNGTDRNRNSRKVRKSYAVSKDWGVPEAVSYREQLQRQLLLAGADTPAGQPC